MIGNVGSENGQSIVIRLRDFESREIRVVTDFIQATTETSLAQMYKAGFRGLSSI